MIALCVLVGWAAAALPLAVVVGRSFAAGHRYDEPDFDLAVLARETPTAPRVDENGHGSAA